MNTNIKRPIFFYLEKSILAEHNFHLFHNLMDMFEGYKIEDLFTQEQIEFVKNCNPNILDKLGNHGSE